jgi:hypothetical protein
MLKLPLNSVLDFILVCQTDPEYSRRFIQVIFSPFFSILQRRPRIFKDFFMLGRIKKIFMYFLKPAKKTQNI